uniref:Uncharacterized protein n=1 Tax=Desulfomonile tiedjei TaxID=2358 RepID=A0A7C4AQK9_9BACT
MTDFQETPRCYFLLPIALVFLLVAPLTGSSGHIMASAGPDLYNGLQISASDGRAAQPERQALNSDSINGIRDAQSRSKVLHLAQTLPFQAPATPEIEPQTRTTRPAQGNGRKDEAISEPRKDRKTVTPANKAARPGDATEGRTATPTSSPAKKKRTEVKPRASAVPESTSKKPLESPGFQPLTPSAPSAGVSSSSALPPLPPAMPYTPPAGAYAPGQTTSPTPLAAPSRPSPALAKPKPSDGGLPSGMPVGPGGSLDNFVLDSFKAGAAQGALPNEQTAGQKVPPSSLFGQLSQDMKQLGEGIKETFRSLLSLR